MNQGTAVNGNPSPADLRPPTPPSTATPTNAKSIDKVLFLKEIHVDYAWNCRSQARTTLKGSHVTDDDPESPGIEGLARSMQLGGQDTPVCVVPVKGGYELRAGFRRVSAAKILDAAKVAIAGLEIGQIRARVYEGLTADEQRLLNIRENVDRESLTPSDLVYAMVQVKHLPQTEIAERLGKSQAHVSRLLKIGNNLKPGILAAWRMAPAPLSLFDMHDVAMLKAEDQEAAYAKACTPPSETDPRDKEWVEAACKRSAKIGALLGELHREGFLAVGTVTREEVEEGSDDEGAVIGVDPADLNHFIVFVRNFVTFKLKESGGKEVSKARVKKIADAAYKTFLAQLEMKQAPETEEEEEEEEEEAPAAKGKGKKGN